MKDTLISRTTRKTDSGKTESILVVEDPGVKYTTLSNVMPRTNLYTIFRNFLVHFTYLGFPLAVALCPGSEEVFSEQRR